MTLNMNFLELNVLSTLRELPTGRTFARSCLTNAARHWLFEERANWGGHGLAGLVFCFMRAGPLLAPCSRSWTRMYAGQVAGLDWISRLTMN